MLFETTTSSGTTSHALDTASTNFNVDSTGSSVSALVPEDATVRTAVLSTEVTSLTANPTPSLVSFSIGSSSTINLAEGHSTVSLSPSMIAHMNMVQPTHTQVQTGRDWRVVEFDFSTSGLADIDVNAIIRTLYPTHCTRMVT